MVNIMLESVGSLGRIVSKMLVWGHWGMGSIVSRMCNSVSMIILMKINFSKVNF